MFLERAQEASGTTSENWRLFPQDFKDKNDPGVSHRGQAGSLSTLFYQCAQWMEDNEQHCRNESSSTFTKGSLAVAVSASYGLKREIPVKWHVVLHSLKASLSNCELLLVGLQARSIKFSTVRPLTSMSPFPAMAPSDCGMGLTSSTFAQ